MADYRLHLLDTSASRAAASGGAGVAATRPAAGADAEHAGAQDDEGRRARSALSDRDRRILLLHAWEGLGGADLAAVLGTSRGGADAALSRARARLRTAWAEQSALAQETGA